MGKNNYSIIKVSDFLDEEWRVYGNKQNCNFENGILTTQDCWAVAQNIEFENIDFRFMARAPKDATQVDIWACFRHYNREHRYMVGLRGGNHKHLYLARMGAVGYDKMLASCPLEWSAMPGVWYSIRVVCAKDTIAVYLNDEEKPYIVCKDEDAPFKSGSIGLGSSYIKTEYKDVSVKEVSADILKGVEKRKDFLDEITLPPSLRESTRCRNRATYRPYVIPVAPQTRIELSLDGEWLFIPDYEAKDNPADLMYDDSKAHMIKVPSSWVPLFAWLEGETMGDLNKGQCDNYHLEEYARCMNQTFDYKNTKSGWYRHYIDFPKNIENKRVVLDFEAIAVVSAVYCNGVKVHENIGMFTPMQIDISDYIHEGRNIIAVQTHCGLPESSSNTVETDFVDNNYAIARQTSDAPVSNCVHREFCTEDIPHGIYSNNPSGIWRSVKMIISEKLHIEDCWFRPTLEDATIEITYINGLKNLKDVSLKYSLVHKTTGEFLCGGDVETVSLKSGEKRVVTIKTPKVSPRLWGPGTPNLYRLELSLHHNDKLVDTYIENVGFKTVHFEGSTLIYNGKPMWVRGANHMPAHIKPNDKELARKYIDIALEHNLMATRTHISPWGATWLDVADEGGLMVSLEGTWPWLMIENIPSQKALEVWKAELRKLFHRNRNRPSLFLVTLNNEMNFYLKNDPDEVVKEKGYHVQGGLKIAREEFPDLPLVCDSGYYRGPTTKHGRDTNFKVANGRYERIIQANNYDDGDMDDPHSYYGWYFVDFFHFMNGEFGRDITLPGRPCMSQECSVGYCRSEDGHATRHYLFEHQTPQTTTGKRAYEHNDPRYFQHHHAFQLQGLVEMFRRVEHERTCGVLLFAFETWFYHHYDVNRIQPMLSANRLKMAYQPVLASADLFGRHFYAGKKLNTNVTIINDSNNQKTLEKPKVEAQIVADDKVLVKSEICYDDIEYFKTVSMPLVLQIPKKLPKHHTQAKLVLKVWENNNLISKNDYDILLADENWTNDICVNDKIWYIENDGLAMNVLKNRNLASNSCVDISSLIGKKDRLVIGKTLNEQQAKQVYDFVKLGGKVIMINQRDLPLALLDGKSISYTEDCTEIMTMNIPESSLFNGIDELDTAWFENGRDVPYVAYGRYDVDRKDCSICALGETLQWHNYIAKLTEYAKIGGTPLFSLKIGEGAILVSSIRTNADNVDPVAYRLTGNILTWDFDEVL